VPGYKFVSERLQEYREHWDAVDWQRGASFAPLVECAPDVKFDDHV
jgi:hypothetical protein